MTEATLLERIAAGEDRAVAACIEHHGPRVWSVARRYLRDEADAEECVQDVFLELWRVAGRFDPTRASEDAFVATLARRRVIDRLRARSRSLDVDPAGDVEALVATEPTTPEASNDTARAVSSALAALDPERRGIVHLAVWLGLSHQEIAHRTGLPLGTIKSHLRRGFATLRTHIERARGSHGH